MLTQSFTKEAKAFMKFLKKEFPLNNQGHKIVTLYSDAPKVKSYCTKGSASLFNTVTDGFTPGCVRNKPGISTIRLACGRNNMVVVLRTLAHEYGHVKHYADDLSDYRASDMTGREAVANDFMRKATKRYWEVTGIDWKSLI